MFKAMTRFEWLRTVTRVVESVIKPKRERSKKEKVPFHFVMPNGVVFEVRHWTRSEARAGLKKQLGLDKLPPGIKRP